MLRITRRTLNNAACSIPARAFLANVSEKSPLVTPPVKGPKQKAWPWLKAYVKHTIHASKLSYYDVKWWQRARKNPQLSYEEQMKLRTITGDIYKLIPFSVIVIVPFAELLLPFYLVLYQDAIPSRYFKEEHMKKAYFNAAKSMEESGTHFRKFLSETLDALKELQLKPEEIQALSTLKLWTQRGIASENSATILPLVPTFEKHVWPIIKTNAKLLRELLPAVNKRPITGLYYANSLLSYANIKGPTLATPLLRILGTPFLRKRIESAVQTVERFDNALSAEIVDKMGSTLTIETALLRGINPLMRSEKDVKDDIKNWLELRKKNVPASLLFVLNTCKK